MFVFWGDIFQVNRRGCVGRAYSLFATDEGADLLRIDVCWLIPVLFDSRLILVFFYCSDELKKIRLLKRNISDILVLPCPVMA